MIHWFLSKVSSSKQSAIFLSFPSERALRSLTAERVSNRSWSLFFPADFTTIWKSVRSSDHKITEKGGKIGFCKSYWPCSVEVIVAVLRQLYKIASSPKRLPAPSLQTSTLSGPLPWKLGCFLLYEGRYCTLVTLTEPCWRMYMWVPSMPSRMMSMSFL